MQTLKILIFLVCCASTRAFEISDFEKSVIDLTNAERKKEGLGELKLAEKLFTAARNHAANMAKKDELAHVLDGQNVTDRAEKLGYKYFTVGENVAYNQQDAEGLLKSWMESPGHRANILKKEFTEIGIGVAKNEKGEPYYAQVFGRPQSAGPTVRATISISNLTDEPIKVRLPDTKASTEIESGGTGSFTLNGAGELPPAKVKIGDETRDVDMKDGAKYRVRSTRRGIEITDNSAEEKKPRRRNSGDNTVETGAGR